MVPNDGRSYSAFMNQRHTPWPVEHRLRRTLADFNAFAQREPVQAMTVGVCLGLLASLLPARLLLVTAALTGALLVRPVLLSLGITKALELCCQKTCAHHNS